MQFEVRCTDALPLDVDVCRTETSGYTVPECGIMFPENQQYDPQMKDFEEKLAKLQGEVDALYTRELFHRMSIKTCTSRYSCYSNKQLQEID